jgi:hypothetical protein
VESDPRSREIPPIGGIDARDRIRGSSAATGGDPVDCIAAGGFFFAVVEKRSP